MNIFPTLCVIIDIMKDIQYHYEVMTKLPGTDFLPSIEETMTYLGNDPSMDDLLYVGGAITPISLLAGYQKGLFPMKIEDADEEFVGWFSPRSRAVIQLHPENEEIEIKMSKSLKKAIKGFEFKVDTCFRDVVELCATLRTEGNWIDEDYINVYEQLFIAGYAHSYEVYDRSQPAKLVGGLFGIGVGGFFSGESMFHLVSNASKAAFAHLIEDLRSKEYKLLDGQWPTHHLKSLGMLEVDRLEYLRMLKSLFCKNV